VTIGYNPAGSPLNGRVRDSLRAGWLQLTGARDLAGRPIVTLCAPRT
jgi:hypothetical protein